MTDASLIALFVRPLNQLRIPYLVTGGVASVIYGEPRLTRDIDLVIRLAPRDAHRFSQAWPAESFYVGHFNLSHHETALRADVYLPGDDPLNAWAFAHPTVREVDGERVTVAPIEAVILSKLKCFKMGRSDRHLTDIALMLRISGDLVDRRAVDRWAARLDLEREWKRAREHFELL